MRRPHALVLGVVVALGFSGCAGCARPVAGRASYQVGAAAGAGARPSADSGPASPTRTHRPAARRTHRPARHSAPPATTPSAPPPTHPQAPPAATTKPSQSTDQQPPTLAEFSVCLSLFQLSRAPDGAFRALPRHASMSSRTQVARAYTTAYRRMMKILRASGLPPDDVVRLQATEVASATRAMARALPSGSGVSNRQLRAAFVKLTQLCAH